MPYLLAFRQDVPVFLQQDDAFAHDAEQRIRRLSFLTIARQLTRAALLPGQPDLRPKDDEIQARLVHEVNGISPGHEYFEDAVD